MGACRVSACCAPGARPGDAICVSGALGGAARALATLNLTASQPGRLSPLERCYWQPQPPFSLAAPIARPCQQLHRLVRWLAARLGPSLPRQRRGRPPAKRPSALGARRPPDDALRGGTTISFASPPPLPNCKRISRSSARSPRCPACIWTASPRRRPATGISERASPAASRHRPQSPPALQASHHHPVPRPSQSPFVRTLIPTAKPSSLPRKRGALSKSVRSHSHSHSGFQIGDRADNRLSKSVRSHSHSHLNLPFIFLEGCLNPRIRIAQPAASGNAASGPHAGGTPALPSRTSPLCAIAGKKSLSGAPASAQVRESRGSSCLQCWRCTACRPSWASKSPRRGALASRARASSSSCCAWARAG